MNAKTTTLLGVFGLYLTLPLGAVVHSVSISPDSDALNLGTTTYTQDHALGFSGLNLSNPNASTASGNAIGGGLSFDDVTNVLSFEFAYGSDFGFSDLTGDFTFSNLHSPGAVNVPGTNTSGGIIEPLNSFHTAGSSARTGSFSGSVILSDDEETALFNNEIHININSTSFVAGEIRGQLVVVPEPSSALLLFSTAGLALVRRRRA